MANYLKMLVSDLFLQLALVNVQLLGKFLNRILKERDVLVIFFTLDDDFLDLAFLLAQDFSSFSMTAAFFVELQFNVTDLEIEHDQVKASIQCACIHNCFLFTLASNLLMILLLLTSALVSTSSKRMVRFLISTSKAFLMDSILTMRSCSSWRTSIVCLSST